MAQHVLYGKRKLCYTEVTDFTDFQGIGRDPLYKRFDSVYSVVEKNIDPQYRDFLAHPIYDEDQILWYVHEWNNIPCAYKDLPVSDKDKYATIKEKTIAVYEGACKSLTGEDKQILTGVLKYIDEDFMFCYDDKVVVVAWGMVPDSHKHVVKGAVIHDIKTQNKHKIEFFVGENGSLPDKLANVVSRTDGTILSYRDLPVVTPKKGFVFKCWEPNPIGMKVDKPLTFVANYEDAPIEEEKIPVEEIEEHINEPETVRVTFVCGQGGYLSGTTEYTINKGSYFNDSLIPFVIAHDGFKFVGWNDSTSKRIEEDTIFEAILERDDVTCKFIAGEHGSIDGQDTFVFPYGTTLDITDIPKLKANKGYRFTGWDMSPTDYVLNNDVTFTAQYEKKTPWYKKLWLWLTGKGCLKWILWFLLLILFIWLLSWLLRGCNKKSNNRVEPIDRIETPSGDVIDNNGQITPIVGDNGKLPDNSVVAPIVGEDGTEPPIIHNPGAPDIIENRLNIYFENADVDLDKFISDLAKVYPEGQCQVIGYDKHVPMIQILIPENQRDDIREGINAKLPEYDFFVVDESIFTIVGNENIDTENIGWHLDAIDLKEGWEITQGSPEIVVAVVDDGIDANHDILRGRIVSPYNVFTQDNRLSIGEGHGTHVAGLSVGDDKNFDEGISGIAPKCKLMPIQVFDNGLCTFSSVTSGIMYAIHNGANVVNVSIGPNFKGLDILPIEDQEHIARTQFKNEEIVWKRIINVANENNVIIVFAAGNDNILANIPPENRTNRTLNVAAVDMQIQGTDFTNYGIGSNISAPGKDIVSSIPNDEYAVFNGTSMAAPIVSGTVALMMSCKPDITVTEALHILQVTGTTISSYMPPMIQVDDALIALTTGNIPELPSESDDRNGGDDSSNASSGNNNNDDQPTNPSSENNPSPDKSNGENNSSVPGVPSEGRPNDGDDTSSPSAGDNSSPDNSKEENNASAPDSPSKGKPNTEDNPNADKETPSSNGNHGKGSDNDNPPEEKKGTDYDEIRKLIEFYKERISELEKLLPENK